MLAKYVFQGYVHIDCLYAMYEMYKFDIIFGNIQCHYLILVTALQEQLEGNNNKLEFQASFVHTLHTRAHTHTHTYFCCVPCKLAKAHVQTNEVCIPMQATFCETFVSQAHYKAD